MNVECLMKLNECPMLWTLALEWLIEMFVYGMSLQMSLFGKWNNRKTKYIGLIQLGIVA